MRVAIGHPIGVWLKSQSEVGSNWGLGLDLLGIVPLDIWLSHLRLMIYKGELMPLNEWYEDANAHVRGSFPGFYLFCPIKVIYSEVHKKELEYAYEL